MSKSMDELRRELVAQDFARKHYGAPDPKLAIHGEARHAIHDGKATSRPLSDGYQQVGLAGDDESKTGEKT